MNETSIYLRKVIRLNENIVTMTGFGIHTDTFFACSKIAPSQPYFLNLFSLTLAELFVSELFAAVLKGDRREPGIGASMVPSGSCHATARLSPNSLYAILLYNIYCLL
jgi:hypothetical protein